eukprot:33606_1
MINYVKFSMEQKWYIMDQMDQIQLIEPRNYQIIQLLLHLLVFIIYVQYTTESIYFDGINGILFLGIYYFVGVYRKMIFFYEKHGPINIHLYYTWFWIIYN